MQTASFRVFVYSGGLAGVEGAEVFKTGALNHSAIPPLDFTRKSRFGCGSYTGAKRTASAGVTGRAFSLPIQAAFRKTHPRNDAGAGWRREGGFGMAVVPNRMIQAMGHKLQRGEG